MSSCNLTEYCRWSLNFDKPRNYDAGVPFHGCSVLVQGRSAAAAVQWNAHLVLLGDQCAIIIAGCHALCTVYRLDSKTLTLSDEFELKFPKLS